MPPFFGVSAAQSAAPRMAARLAASKPVLIPIASSRRVRRSVEPDRRQILIDVVTWADLPSLDIRPVGNDPAPPQYPNLVGLGIEHVFTQEARSLELRAAGDLARLWPGAASARGRRISWRRSMAGSPKALTRLILKRRRRCWTSWREPVIADFSYYRPSARCCRALRVSADRAARPGPHTRRKPRLLDLERRINSANSSPRSRGSGSHQYVNRGMDCGGCIYFGYSRSVSRLAFSSHIKDGTP